MLGWEFPPFISGGLGTACYGLTKAMSSLGTDVMFVLPRPVTTPFSTHVKLVSPHPGSPLASPTTEFRLDEFENVTFRTIDAQMADPYQKPADYQPPKPKVVEQRTKETKTSSVQVMPATTTQTPTDAHAATQQAPPPAPGAANPYAGDMFSEIARYAALAAEIARNETFDVVHAHDWMTFPAGLAVAGIKGVPLVIHVHSTEFDRSGVNVNQRIYDIERRGMHGAMKIIAVSVLTKNICTHSYGVNPDKIDHADDFALFVFGHPEVAAGRAHVGALDVVDVEAGVVGGERSADEAFGIEFPACGGVGAHKGANSSGRWRGFGHGEIIVASPSLVGKAAPEVCAAPGCATRAGQRCM